MSAHLEANDSFVLITARHILLYTTFFLYLSSNWTSVLANWFVIVRTSFAEVAARRRPEVVLSSREVGRPIIDYLPLGESEQSFPFYYHLVRSLPTELPVVF